MWMISTRHGALKFVKPWTAAKETLRQVDEPNPNVVMGEVAEVKLAALPG
jgi:hypothetical protein